MRNLLIAMLALLLPLGAQRQELPPEAFCKDTYTVKYKLGPIVTKVADAYFSIGEATWQQEDAYFSDVSIKAAHIFRLFLAEEYRGRTYMSAASLEPLYSNLPFHKNGMDSKFEFIYNKEREVVEWNIVNAKEDIHMEYSLDGYTMDLLAFSLYLRTINPADITESLQMRTMLGRQCPHFKLCFFGEDPSYLEGRTAYHYVLFFDERGIMENSSGKDVHIWVDSQSRQILGLQAQLNKGSLLVKIQL